MCRKICYSVFLIGFCIVIASLSFYGYHIYMKYNSVDCESVSVQNLYHEKMFQVAICNMNEMTVINETNVPIYTSQSSNIRHLIFTANHNIQYLPVKIYKAFPELVVIEANSCEIKEISRKNFKNLRLLKVLKLSSNQITTIEGGIFDENPILTHIDLSKI